MISAAIGYFDERITSTFTIREALEYVFLNGLKYYVYQVIITLYQVGLNDSFFFNADIII